MAKNSTPKNTKSKDTISFEYSGKTLNVPKDIVECFDETAEGINEGHARLSKWLSENSFHALSAYAYMEPLIQMLKHENMKAVRRAEFPANTASFVDSVVMEQRNRQIPFVETNRLRGAFNAWAKTLPASMREKLVARLATWKNVCVIQGAEIAEKEEAAKIAQLKAEIAAES